MIPDVTDVSHEGQIALPRLLVVDAAGALFDFLKSHPERYRKVGFEPIFIAYDSKGTEGGLPLPAIVAHAKNPENRIAAVVMGNLHDLLRYGMIMTQDLKSEPDPFKGPVAIHAISDPNAQELREAQEAGAIGMYNKNLAANHPKSAVSALMDAYRNQQKGIVG